MNGTSRIAFVFRRGEHCSPAFVFYLLRPIIFIDGIAGEFCAFLVSGYKKFISPMLGNNCRFTPSCSEYSMEAFELHGFVKGTWLTAKRLLKCAPWCEGGYDPVPRRGEHCSPWRPKVASMKCQKRKTGEQCSPLR